ncbi:helix-turn-helix domain-containing protein [Pseudomonas tolaasii]|uniref:helix-turn-helix domain-containing protein n=1 Tax=Pseudomonas tolaasii TaxID=29442 RepID=UPI00159F7431|nr:helix-turn-helix domain-containing protein [Pseudomonas tolaasii]NWC38634.1 helix-turn-helix domain-containing protein [Pseudomonas tolaasii]
MYKHALRLIPNSSRNIYAPLLTPEELAILDARIGANADALIAAYEKNRPVIKVAAGGAGEGKRGRPIKKFFNPFFRYLGPQSDYGRYPEFALNALTSIARMDWYGERKASAGKYMPLSVRKIMEVLERVETVTAWNVQDCLRLGKRQSQRYVKAVEMVIPLMMEARPKALIESMAGVERAWGEGVHHWSDVDDLAKPSAEELAKLHHDLRTLSDDEWEGEQLREAA